VIVTFVSTDGQQGEDDDYFADHCDGVTVTIPAATNAGASATDYVALSGLDTAETKLLKSCLGDSNGDATDNVEVYNWDYGTAAYPHLIKLVRTVTSYNDGGYYAALYWHSGTSTFRLVNPFVPPDALTTDTYDVYTTKGILKQTSTTAQAYFGYGAHHIVTTTTIQSTDVLSDESLYDGDISCESNPLAANVAHCLNHSDIFTVLDFASPQANAPYINLYTAKRVWTTEYKNKVGDQDSTLTSAAATVLVAQELHRGTNVIETDLALNWGSEDIAYSFNVYKFVPNSASTYNYVAPCSNRGICNTDSGICSCFAGYTSDACSVQNSLAL